MAQQGGPSRRRPLDRRRFWQLRLLGYVGRFGGPTFASPVSVSSLGPNGPPPVDSFLLLANGIDFLLLVDGASKILLA